MLTYKKVLDAINKGGATWTLNNFNVPTDGGYMVGVRGNTYDLSKDIDVVITKVLIDFAYINDIITLLDADVYLGAWVNKGTLYIDFSKHIMDIGVAIALGRFKEQKAIWDIKNEREITL